MKRVVKFTKFSGIDGNGGACSKEFKSKREAVEWLQDHNFEAWGSTRRKPCVFWNGNFRAIVL